MLFSYGGGEYIEGERRVKGEIVLGEHKLYLRGPQGDLASTYIPLEKIVKIKKSAARLNISVRTSSTVSFCAELIGKGKLINSLLKDLVRYRGLKKRFLRNEWVDITEIHK